MKVADQAELAQWRSRITGEVGGYMLRVGGGWLGTWGFPEPYCTTVPQALAAVFPSAHEAELTYHRVAHAQAPSPSCRFCG